MANAHETTFKDLRTEGRFKKLERTLKMVVLKNADRRSGDSGHAGTWPSISSINGDHLDTSYAAMSQNSSRIGSVVVASSANFRNSQSYNNRFASPRPNLVTSSENQFPINKKSTDDRSMMPPPSTPGIDFGRSKRLGEENKRVALLNMPLHPGRSNNDYTISTPASSTAIMPECVNSASVKATAAFPKDVNYTRNAYEENTNKCPQRPERSFSRWRVILNDREQLIIKGTLECGKVARSKPVIRRLTATSVQSVFKHIYHLEGNIVDERSELPDYIRGKFYNGFPDDWENVYQVWRNYINDGSRLSFRWPTAITDSDDDIKSEITEISYHPVFDKRKKSVSPRKRARTLKGPSAHAVAAEDVENRPNSNSRYHSQNASDGATPQPARTHSLQPAKTMQVPSNGDRDENRENGPLEQGKKSRNSTNGSLNNTDRSCVNSLIDIFQEDKINIIVDNLTNKNCSLEYINKIVEMFGCIKYVVSYQSTEENNLDENSSAVHEKATSSSSKKQNRSTEADHSLIAADTKNCSRIAKGEHPENTPSAFVIPDSIGKEKPYTGRYVQHTRRKLTDHDYDSYESENDYYDYNQRSATNRLSRSQRLKRRSHRNDQNYQIPMSSKINGKYAEPDSTFENSHRVIKYTESSSLRSNRHDSSLSEEEPVEGRRFEPKTPHNRMYAIPRKPRISDKETRRKMDHYDSSISITEDEDRHADKTNQGREAAREDQYDSCVSITEDEHGDNRGDSGSHKTLKYHPEPDRRPFALGTRRNSDNLEMRQNSESLQYYSQPNPRSFELDPSRNGDVRFDRKKTDSVKYPVSKFRPVAPDTGRNSPQTGTPRKMPAFSEPTVDDDNRNTRAGRTASQNQASNAVGMNDYVTEQHEDSANLAPDIKRVRKSDGNRDTIETNSSKSCAISRPQDSQNSQEFGRTPRSPEPAAPKSMTSQVKKKPFVVSSEQTNINLRSRLNLRCGDNNVKNAIDPSQDRSRVNPVFDDAKNAPIIQTTSPDEQPEPAKYSESTVLKSTNKATQVQSKAEDGKSSTEKKRSEKAEKTSVTPKETPTAQFGSRENPKQLTGWVPAVVCDDEGDSKYHLIFEGKLLNEAGHVVNRKFTTNFIRRRVSARLVETISQEFYLLIGDFRDTKQVVPKELVKLCHGGCPGKIGQFCERWRTLTADNNKTPPNNCSHDKSVDCLTVPTSSRGRRILPPLNYWEGERIVTIDNKAIYSLGNSQESSIASSLEKTSNESTERKNPSKTKNVANSGVQNGKRKDESKTTKRKDSEQVSPTIESPPQSTKDRSSQKTRGGKRRLTKNRVTSSTDSESDEETKPTPRKRKTIAINPVLNTESTSTRPLKKSGKNKTASSQSLEDTNVSPGQESSEKFPEPEAKAKLRKRPKIDYGEESSGRPANPKQFLTRRDAVTCTYYKNVPSRDDDLSEDQLSTM